MMTLLQKPARQGGKRSHVACPIAEATSALLEADLIANWLSKAPKNSPHSNLVYGPTSVNKKRLYDNICTIFLSQHGCTSYDCTEKR